MNTPEQVALEIRLDQIFSPVYRRQRQAFYEKQLDATQARFVHYTSADAPLKIITSKHMWMRKVNYIPMKYAADFATWKCRAGE